MYQVIIRTWVDGERQMDSVYTKMYAKRGFAERKAKEYIREYRTDHHVKQEAYVRPVLKMVTKEEAKRAYCRDKSVYVGNKYGQELLTPSGWYGSHAPAEELFYRGVDNLVGYGKWNEVNYYVEF